MHHCVKVANPAGLVPLPPIEGVRLAAGGAKHPPRGFRGIPPDRPLVTFVVKRKSPGCRAWQGHALAERPLKGRAEGQRPSHIRGMQGPCPCSSSPGETQSPLHLYPEKLQKLHPNVQPHRKKNKKIGGPPCLFGGEPLCMLRLTTHQHVPSNATCDPGKIIVPQLLKIAGKSVIITKLDCIH